MRPREIALGVRRGLSPVESYRVIVALSFVSKKPWQRLGLRFVNYPTRGQVPRMCRIAQSALADIRQESHGQT
jgi:hypothetical protein